MNLKTEIQHLLLEVNTLIVSYSVILYPHVNDLHWDRALQIEELMKESSLQQKPLQIQGQLIRSHYMSNIEKAENKESMLNTKRPNKNISVPLKSQAWAKE